MQLTSLETLKGFDIETNEEIYSVSVYFNRSMGWKYGFVWANDYLDFHKDNPNKNYYYRYV